MKYFTRQWATGELPEEERHAILFNYQDHLQRLVDEAPGPVADLARQNLHDALIRSVLWDPDAGTLALSLRYADPQTGTFDLDLNYAGVGMTSRDVANLRSRHRDPRTGILDHEVDRHEGGNQFAHRLLFWPRDEIEIRFAELEFRKAPQADRSSPSIPA
jgi:hypothetical protein